MSILNSPPSAQSEPKPSGRERVFFLRGPQIRKRELPVATLTLVVVNVIAFLLTLFAGGLNSGEGLLDFGASYGPYVRAGEYWRLITAMFLHGGFGHLALNMFGLYV